MNLAVFEIGGCLFACPSEYVETVIDANEALAFDMGPKWVDGIVELAGRQILVIDISKILKIDSNNTKSLMVIDINGDQICLKADEFVGYMDVPGNTTAKSISGDIGTLSGVLVGMFKLDHKKYHLLNLAQLSNTPIYTGSHI